MQFDMKVRTLRVMGGLVAALAVVPWLGMGTAQAAGSSDDSCSTRPSGVSGDASCDLLLGPNGTKVFGETWAVRTSDNHLVIWTFPDLALGASDAVQLCVRSTGPYPAKHACTAFEADNAWGGSSTTIDLPLGSHGVSATDKAYWALSVQQGSSLAVSSGGAGCLHTSPSATPTTTATHSHSPSATPTTTATHSHSPSATPTTTATHSHSPSSTPTTTATHSHSPSSTPTTTATHSHSPSPSPSVSSTTTSTTSSTPSSSVLPTKLTASPSTSVLGTKLAHTGSEGVGGALALSITLLGLGGILVVAAQTVPAASRRRH